MDHDTPTRERATLDVEPNFETPAAPDFQLPTESAPLARATRAQVLPMPDLATGASLTSARAVVRHSDQIDQLITALAAAQCEPDYGDIEKTKQAEVESKRTGARYKYDYETLSDVIRATRPHLAKHGLVVLQFPFPSSQTVLIRTRLAHASGQWIENDLTASIASIAPQDVGSGISFLRRYAQKSILNVAADDEDDDAQAATRQPPPQPTPRKSQQAPVSPGGAVANASPDVSKPVPAASPSSTGVIAGVDDRNGGALVKLDTGFVAQARGQDIVRACKAFFANGQRVELACRASSDPTKFAPIIEEIVAQKREG